MKYLKIFLNWRYYVLFIFASIAFIGVFSCPYDDSETWFSDFFISKAIGFGAGYIWYRLHIYFESRNEIPEFERLLDEDEEDYWE